METKKEEEAASQVPLEGTCAVDIRWLLFTLVVFMVAAFNAGIAVHLPLEKLLPRPLTSTAPAVVAKKKTTLQISPADLVIAGPHSPSGQHIIVDMRGIEADFLDSEERLSEAMVQAVEEASLSMLSYHCHKLNPSGISCVGILLESHISFHTWPKEGVITLDLFTCGTSPLLPVVPVIQRLFGIGENIVTKWSHDLRGFRSPEDKKKNYLDNFSDLALWILSPLELHTKTRIYSNLTKYQRVDIWDISDYVDFPTYADGIKHNLPDGDPRWTSPDFHTPDRILFLDGTIQSISSFEVVYHEALVHPAMFAHNNPKRVAVLGGGEGATIREVLKHKTVESVTMIDIDSELIAICREHLPKMSDCSDFTGRADSCFDDPALKLVFENGITYFLDRHGPDRTIKDPPKPFDVLIIDALDPEEEVGLAKDLYADDAFVSSLLRSLADDGILLLQIGTAPEISDPKASIGSYRIREKLFTLFENHPDVATMHVYEEGKCGFLEPHSFLMVCKNISCRSRWYATSDVIQYEIYDRILPSKTSGQTTLKYYDGVTHNSYQVPPMAWESVYCRREPTPFECAYRTLDFKKDIHEMSLEEGEGSFRVELRKDSAGETVESSVFATVDIVKGSYIMPGDLAKSLMVESYKITAINENAAKSSDYAAFAEFIESNSHKADAGSADVHFVEIGGPTMIRRVDGDGNVARWVPPHPSGKRPPYSPVYDRHSRSLEVFLVASENISAGTELTRSRSA